MLGKKFLELLSIVLPKHNNTTNPLIQIFSDSLEAIGIRQIIEEYTHKDGNMLCQQDLHWSVGEFLSDHRYVKAQFKFEKNGVSFKKITSRNLKDRQLFLKSKLEDLNIKESNCINEVVSQFETSLLKILDHTAPVVT